jgi:hypothetical protein
MLFLDQNPNIKRKELTATPFNENKIHGVKAINPNKIGKNTTQQRVISWSYLILGKLALTHIKEKTIIEVLIPNVNPLTKPPIIGLSNISVKIFLESYISQEE